MFTGTTVGSYIINRTFIV